MPKGKSNKSVHFADVIPTPMQSVVVPEEASAKKKTISQDEAILKVLEYATRFTDLHFSNDDVKAITDTFETNINLKKDKTRLTPTVEHANQMIAQAMDAKYGVDEIMTLAFLKLMFKHEEVFESVIETLEKLSKPKEAAQETDLVKLVTVLLKKDKLKAEFERFQDCLSRRVNRKMKEDNAFIATNPTGLDIFRQSIKIRNDYYSSQLDSLISQQPLLTESTDEKEIAICAGTLMTYVTVFGLNGIASLVIEQLKNKGLSKFIATAVFVGPYQRPPIMDVWLNENIALFDLFFNEFSDNIKTARLLFCGRVRGESVVKNGMQVAAKAGNYRLVARMIELAVILGDFNELLGDCLTEDALRLFFSDDETILSKNLPVLQYTLLKLIDALSKTNRRSDAKFAIRLLQRNKGELIRLITQDESIDNLKKLIEVSKRLADKDLDPEFFFEVIQIGLRAACEYGKAIFVEEYFKAIFKFPERERHDRLKQLLLDPKTIDDPKHSNLKRTFNAAELFNLACRTSAAVVGVFGVRARAFKDHDETLKLILLSKSSSGDSSPLLEACRVGRVIVVNSLLDFADDHERVRRSFVANTTEAMLKQSPTAMAVALKAKLDPTKRSESIACVELLVWATKRCRHPLEVLKRMVLEIDAEAIRGLVAGRRLDETIGLYRALFGLIEPVVHDPEVQYRIENEWVKHFGNALELKAKDTLLKIEWYRILHPINWLKNSAKEPDSAYRQFNFKALFLQVRWYLGLAPVKKPEIMIDYNDPLYELQNDLLKNSNRFFGNSVDSIIQDLFEKYPGMDFLHQESQVVQNKLLAPLSWVKWLVDGREKAKVIPQTLAMILGFHKSESFRDFIADKFRILAVITRMSKQETLDIQHWKLVRFSESIAVLKYNGSENNADHIVEIVNRYVGFNPQHENATSGTTEAAANLPKIKLKNKAVLTEIKSALADRPIVRKWRS